MSVNPKTVGAPSVKRRMYRNELKPTEFSVWSHCAIACSVFVQPPEYTILFVSVIVFCRSSSRAIVSSTLVPNETRLKRTVEVRALLSISALKSVMNRVANSFVSV